MNYRSAHPLVLVGNFVAVGGGLHLPFCSKLDVRPRLGTAGCSHEVVQSALAVTLLSFFVSPAGKDISTCKVFVDVPLSEVRSPPFFTGRFLVLRCSPGLSIITQRLARQDGQNVTHAARLQSNSERRLFVAFWFGATPRGSDPQDCWLCTKDPESPLLHGKEVLLADHHARVISRARTYGLQ